MKPPTQLDYDAEHTRDCERLLVTLLRRLGPWRDSVYLVGGLTPRYLVPARPPVVPAHAGTLDVDIVIRLEVLATTEAYQTLEANLKGMGLARAPTESGQRSSWQWEWRTEKGALIRLELLADDPTIQGGVLQPLPSKGTLSAMNIPHASMVFDLYQETTVTVELLGASGVTTEIIRHANLVSFTCLKAFAFEDRAQHKDAHDLLYCIEHAPQYPEEVAGAFREARDGAHASAIRNALAILRKRFVTDADSEGYLKDGAVAVARFELGDIAAQEGREQRVLRQRQVSQVMERLLHAIG